jgi:hypothetical protein
MTDTSLVSSESPTLLSTFPTSRKQCSLDFGTAYKGRRGFDGCIHEYGYVVSRPWNPLRYGRSRTSTACICRDHRQDGDDHGHQVLAGPLSKLFGPTRSIYVLPRPAQPITLDMLPQFADRSLSLDSVVYKLDLKINKSPTQTSFH